HGLAAKLLETYNHTDNAQIGISADSDKSAALKSGAGGAMVILDKKFNAESVEKLEKDVVPVGQLWMLKLAPSKDGKVTPNSKLRIVTLGDEDKPVKLPLFLL